MHHIYISIVTIALSTATSIFGNNTCENDAGLCQNDTTCLPIFETYMENCAVVLNATNGNFSYQKGRCPYDCQKSLNEYLQHVYPNQRSTSYCTCNSTQCEVAQDQLYKQQCIATDCSVLYQECMNDTVCAPIYQAFNDTCYQVYTPLETPVWEYKWCPDGCADALDAYVEYVAPNYTSLRFCDCNGEESCIETKSALVKSGCATPVCVDQWEDCAMDDACNATRIAYYNACQDIFHGNFSGTYCPSECRDTLRDYIDMVAPNATTLNFCTCDVDQGCVDAKENLKRFGCVASDCIQYWMDCNEDNECKPIADDYIESCQSVLNGSWTESWCPATCVNNLRRYINKALTNLSYDNPLDYCDCNDDEGCNDGRTLLIEAGCFAETCDKVHEELCETDPVCRNVSKIYIEACNGVFNGTDEFCPIECIRELQEYLPFITDRTLDEITDLDSVCSCAPNSNCETYQDNLMSAGCIKQNCGQIWYNCQQDSECKAIGDQYLIDCASELDETDGSITVCTETCKESLAAYINASASVTISDKKYCTCHGDDSSECVIKQNRLIEIGCITDSCEYQFTQCLAETSCSQIAEDYLAACQIVFNGTITDRGDTNCPYECAAALQAYLGEVYDEFQPEIGDYCNCAGSTGCDEVQSIFQDLGCADPNDCTFNDAICEMDVQCNVKRQNYFTECAMFLGTGENAFNDDGTYMQCPVACSTALREYIQEVYGSTNGEIGEICNCNSNVECTRIQGVLKDLSCLEELTTQMPTAEPASMPTPFSGVNRILIQTAALLIMLISVIIM